MRAFWLVALAISISGQAFAACENRSATVKDYLRAHPDLSLVTPGDLVQDDPKIWAQAHRGLCPGYTVVDWDGSGRKATAISILSGDPDHRKQSVVLIHSDGSVVTLVKPTSFAYPGVIWRTGPGRLRDIQTGRLAVSAYDGVVFEYLEAAATVFYLEKGTVRSVQTSD